LANETEHATGLLSLVLGSAFGISGCNHGCKPNWRCEDKEKPDGTVLVFDSVHDWGGWKCFTAKDDRGRSLP